MRLRIGSFHALRVEMVTLILNIRISDYMQYLLACQEGHVRVASYISRFWNRPRNTRDVVFTQREGSAGNELLSRLVSSDSRACACILPIILSFNFNFEQKVLQ